MKALKTTTILACSLAIAACDNASQSTTDPTQPEPDNATLASGTFIGADDTIEGSVELVSTDNTVVLTASVSGIEPGPHGFHLHQTGTCDVPDFKSAAGHLNPLNKSHGKKSENGAHVGDLMNIEVNQDGAGEITAQLEGTTDQVLEWLFDADGTAVMVHADPDDYTTDPTGSAGARIACAVLERTTTTSAP